MGRGMTEQARDIRREVSVLKREGTGWDIGSAVHFLLSDQARYITGQDLVVDGGATLVGPSRASQGGLEPKKRSRASTTAQAHQPVLPSRACWAASDNDVAG